MIVALDFDGVIVDSAYECLLTTYAAWKGDRAAVPDAAFEQRFLADRYLVRFAGEYAILAYCVENGLPLSDREAFRKIGEDAGLDLPEFERRFFAARAEIVAADPAAWMDLHRVYPEFSSGWDALRAEAEDVFIVSVKDGSSIARLLGHFGIAVPPERILGRERGAHKPEVLSGLARELHRNMEAFVFLDDYLPQVEEMAGLGPACFWAKWGYWPSRDAVPEKVRPCWSLMDVATWLQHG